jgi:hypothetical protein
VVEVFVAVVVLWGGECVEDGRQFAHVLKLETERFRALDHLGAVDVGLGVERNLPWLRALGTTKPTSSW